MLYFKKKKKEKWFVFMKYKRNDLIKFNKILIKSKYNEYEKQYNEYL